MLAIYVIPDRSSRGFGKTSILEEQETDNISDVARWHAIPTLVPRDRSWILLE